jgi:hypothetical protein
MTDNGAPQPTAPGTIVLVHGFWVTPRSWENWVERRRSCCCSSPRRRDNARSDAAWARTDATAAAS